MANKAVTKWLRDFLSNGAQKATDVKEKARDAGIGDKALRRAREKLGIKPRKREFTGPWWWDLQCAQDATTPTLGTPKGPGSLRQPSDGEPDGDETESKAKAVRWTKVAMQPNINAALVIGQLGGLFKRLDTVELMAHLKDGMNHVSNNNLRECEAMLYTQAHVLQSVFLDSLVQATQQEWFPHHEAFMRIALKAQSQCRMTLETLAAIKNPPTVFARQANIAQGPQQVNNNGMMPASEPRAGARGTEGLHNELLEEKPHERLDTGTTGAAIGADPAMAAVGAINRAEDDTA